MGDTREAGYPTVEGEGYLLGLSATGLDGSTLELDHLHDVLGMWCYRSNWIDQADLRREMEVASFEAYLAAARDDAKLVHCEAAQLRAFELAATASGLVARYNVSDPARLRELRPTECLFVTEKRLMRGFDYRGAPIAVATAGTVGADDAVRIKLSLLLACPADTERDHLQALGRVGRYGDACARYRLRGVACVDGAVAARRGGALFDPSGLGAAQADVDEADGPEQRE